MQTAMKTKKPRKQAVSGCFWAKRTYRGRIKDDHKIEPCCGKGSFLTAVTERLVGEAKAAGSFNVATLAPRVVSYDLDQDSVDLSRQTVAGILISNGMAPEDAVSVAEAWVRCGDYLLSNVEPYDFTVGNPPYLRAT